MHDTKGRFCLGILKYCDGRISGGYNSGDGYGRQWDITESEREGDCVAWDSSTAVEAMMGKEHWSEVVALWMEEETRGTKWKRWWRSGPVGDTIQVLVVRHLCFVPSDIELLFGCMQACTVEHIS
eukprot:TRINITY_DN178_c0_g1_i1.p1 TRINITY_DN178_c0_g1~~TRINITY_DN178_c0_g1_i1.p1  ORF type:complete len:125 (-),score=7.70 TRINITY_DN178_c0_g1_i1:1266-1640(-)